MPDTDKPLGKDMQGKSADKLSVFQFHLLFNPAMPIILIIKSDFTVFITDYPAAR